MIKHEIKYNDHERTALSLSFDFLSHYFFFFGGILFITFTIFDPCRPRKDRECAYVDF